MYTLSTIALQASHTPAPEVVLKFTPVRPRCEMTTCLSLRSGTEERLATSVAMRDGLYFMLSTFNVLLGKLKVDDVMSTFLAGKPEEREAYQLNLDRLAHGKLDHAV